VNSRLYRPLIYSNQNQKHQLRHPTDYQTSSGPDFGGSVKLFVQITDDDGEVLDEYSCDPCQPNRWNAPTGQKFIGKMPQQSSDVVNNGTYELFGITFQPHLRVDRPNGWSAPPPDSSPAGLPSYKPSPKPSFPWSKSALNSAPKQNPAPGFPPAAISRG
jgi:hypothetical protein